MKRRDAAVLLISAAVLAYEVVLVRAFSIGQWYHFSYMVISIALLGFGASGTLVAALTRALLDQEIHSPPGPRRRTGWFAASATLFAFTLPLSFWLAQNIPFDPFLIVWDRRQLLYLGSYYVALFLPFFWAATAIGLALVTESERSPTLYFYNLFGSGAGAALAVGFLNVASVEQAALAVGSLAQGAAVLALVDVAPAPGRARARQLWAALGLAAMLGVSLYFLARPIRVRISAYKGLHYALALPHARVVAERSSPLARVDVVESPAIRYAPGLSFAAPIEAIPPPQLGLYVDAETAGAIAAFTGDISKLAYLDWMTTAAPYFSREQSGTPGRVAVLGAGGGSGVLLALRHGAQRVDAVELDGKVLGLMRETFRSFNGGLFARPDVRVHRAEARAFIEAARDRWDVIDLSLVDSFAAAAAGVGAAGESYIYTREAFETYLSHLAPGGRLSLTRWVRMPPRDELKLFATACDALEKLGFSPADRILLIRSWATATLLVKTEPFTRAEIAALHRWAEERLFDTAYFPGIAPGEANRFNVLEHDYYAEGVSAILAGSVRRERFIRDYAFYVRPATDDRPYFFHFFRWRALPLMLRSVGAAWIPFVEWGYIILVATLAQAALLSALLIAMPLLLLRSRIAAHDDGAREPAGGTKVTRAQVFAYFLALGLGYLFVEMVLIQRLVFFLANPVYAVAVVLAGLLFFSGLGSGWAARSDQPQARLASLAAVTVATIALVYAFGLPVALRPLLRLPLAARVSVTLLVMLPLAAMGIPFPAGLRKLGRSRKELLAWAWGINGCASVVATSLATMLAMGAGLRTLLVVAAACYVSAAAVAQKWRED